MPKEWAGNNHCEVYAFKVWTWDNFLAEKIEREKPAPSTWPAGINRHWPIPSWLPDGWGFGTKILPSGTKVLKFITPQGRVLADCSLKRHVEEIVGHTLVEGPKLGRDVRWPEEWPDWLPHDWFVSMKQQGAGQWRYVCIPPSADRCFEKYGVDQKMLGYRPNQGFPIKLDESSFLGLEMTRPAPLCERKDDAPRGREPQITKKSRVGGLNAEDGETTNEKKEKEQKMEKKEERDNGLQVEEVAKEKEQKKAKKEKKQKKDNGLHSEDGANENEQKKQKKEKNPKKQKKEKVQDSALDEPETKRTRLSDNAAANEQGLQSARHLGFPEGWMVHDLTRRRMTFTSPDGKSYTPSNIQGVLDGKIIEAAVAKNRIEQLGLLDAEAFGLPSGWHYKQYPKGRCFFNPQGQIFQSLPKAMDASLQVSQPSELCVAHPTSLAGPESDSSSSTDEEKEEVDEMVAPQAVAAAVSEDAASSSSASSSLSSAEAETPAAPIEPKRKVNWNKHWNADFGLPFWYNPETQESRWEDPDLGDA